MTEARGGGGPGALAPLALAAAVLFSGCAAHLPPGPSSVTASPIRAGAQCGGDSPGVSARWIATEGELRAAMGEGGVFGTEPATPLDFRKEGVLAIYMGQRPTAGYGLALHDPKVAIVDRVGTVVVGLEEPAPGAMVAQVLTSPCLLVRMPRGGLQQVRVVDPAGRLLASVDVRALPAREREQPPRPPGERLP